ncbi:MAG: hypothetical protein ABH914_01535 [Candidatus Omnitrophota bacterium]
MIIKDIFKRFLSPKLSKRERFLFYGVLMITAFFCLERFVFRNIFLQLDLSNKKIIILNLKYQRAKALIANKEIIINAAQAYKDYFDSSLGSQQNPLATILSHIESLAREGGGVIVEMTPGQQVTKASTHSIYTIDIVLQGDLSQVSAFIVDIQKSNFLMEISRATIIPKEQLLQFKAKLSVFVFDSDDSLVSKISTLNSSFVIAGKERSG